MSSESGNAGGESGGKVDSAGRDVKDSGARGSKSSGAARSTALERVIAGGVAAGCLGVLIVAASLDPAGARAGSVGTHEQLGMTACGWLMVTGKPCPTCGMTTAFAHAAQLEPVSAVRSQPAGAVMALGTAVIFWGAMQVTITGSRVWVLVPKVMNRRAAWVAGALLLGSWAYKVAVFAKG